MVATDHPLHRLEATVKKKITRTFTMDEIDGWDLPWGADKGMVLSDEMIDHTRWSVWNQVIFRAPDDGKIWSLSYQTPATERQECDRWPDLKGVQMEAVERTVVVYEEVTVEDGDPS
jgi:hypothetical protein